MATKAAKVVPHTVFTSGENRNESGLPEARNSDPKYLSATSRDGVNAGYLLLAWDRPHGNGLLTKNPTSPLSAWNTHSVTMLKATVHSEYVDAGLVSVPGNWSISGCCFAAPNTTGSRIQASVSEHSSDCREESH